jgi:hypothetical protein
MKYSPKTNDYRLAFTMTPSDGERYEGIVEVLHVGTRDTRDRPSDVWDIVHDPSASIIQGETICVARAAKTVSPPRRGRNPRLHAPAATSHPRPIALKWQTTAEHVIYRSRPRRLGTCARGFLEQARSGTSARAPGMSGSDCRLALPCVGRLFTRRSLFTRLWRFSRAWRPRLAGSR